MNSDQTLAYRQLAGYAKADLPPAGVKRIPLSIAMCYSRLTRAEAIISNCAVADMICRSHLVQPRRAHYEHKPRIIPVPSRGRPPLRG